METPPEDTAFVFFSIQSTAFDQYKLYFYDAGKYAIGCAARLEGIEPLDAGLGRKDAEAQPAEQPADGQTAEAQPADGQPTDGQPTDGQIKDGRETDVQINGVSVIGTHVVGE